MRNKWHFDLNTLRNEWDDEEIWLMVGDIAANVGPWIIIAMVLAMIASAM